MAAVEVLIGLHFFHLMAEAKARASAYSSSEAKVWVLVGVQRFSMPRFSSD
jgi:hypothetical protein